MFILKLLYLPTHALSWEQVQRVYSQPLKNLYIEKITSKLSMNKFVLKAPLVFKLYGCYRNIKSMSMTKIYSELMHRWLITPDVHLLIYSDNLN